MSLTKMNMRGLITCCMISSTGTYEGVGHKYWIRPSSFINSDFYSSYGTYVELNFPGLEINEVIAMAIELYYYENDEDGMILILPGLFEDGSGQILIVLVEHLFKGYF